MDKFAGFEIPEQNWSKLPHSLIDLLPMIDTMAELKVVIYVLRHTWGFSEFEQPKKITVDEFMDGRKRKDGTRIDKGTGLSEQSVRNGLDKGVEHGLLLVEIDESDKARIQKFYGLNIREDQRSKVYTPDPKVYTSGPQELDLDQRKKLLKEKPSREKKPAFRDPTWDLQHGLEPDETPEGKVARELAELYTRTAERLEKGLIRGAFPQTPKAQAVYRWIGGKEKMGESLDAWIQWAMRDPNAISYSWVYHKDPELIKRDWPQAFRSEPGGDQPEKQYKVA